MFRHLHLSLFIGSLIISQIFRLFELCLILTIFPIFRYGRQVDLLFCQFLILGHLFLNSRISLNFHFRLQAIFSKIPIEPPEIQSQIWHFPWLRLTFTNKSRAQWFIVISLNLPNHFIRWNMMKELYGILADHGHLTLLYQIRMQMPNRSLRFSASFESQPF